MNGVGDWFKSLAKSRKFWFGVVMPIVMALAGYATGELTFDKLLATVLGAGVAFAGGVALEDGLAKRAIITRYEQTDNTVSNSGQGNAVGTQSNVSAAVGGNAGDVQTAGRDAHWKG